MIMSYTSHVKREIDYFFVLTYLFILCFSYIITAMGIFDAGLEMKIKVFTGSIVAIISSLLATLTAAAPAMAANLTSVSDTLSDYTPGATVSHTIVFTTVSEIPDGGKIVITFDAGFNLAGASVSSGRIQVGSNHTDVTLSNIPPSLFIRKSSGGVIPGGSAISVHLHNIRNPSLPGTYAVNVKTIRQNLSTIDGPNVSASFTIAPPVPLDVTSESLPGGQLGMNYGPWTLTASGGLAPYHWTKISGDLPQGISLSSSGVISGTPDVAGRFNFTVRVTDSASVVNSDSKDFTITILPAILIPNITVGDKVYDQTRSATIIGRSLIGVIGLDNVTLIGGNAEFTSAAVANNIAVNISGLTLAGTEASNYQLSASEVVANADITPISLTVGGISASDKTYDGNVSATLIIDNPSLSGVLDGDTVTLDTSAASGTFSDANCGAGKTVNITGLILSGNDSGNYTLTQPTAQAAITQATPVIIWSNPADITFGAKLSSIQLNASTGVAGSFSYYPGLDTVLNPGPAQVLSIKFTPTDATNYKTVEKTTNINVIKATLIVNADNKSKTVGGEIPTLTYTIKGYVNGDSAGVVSGTPLLSTPATTGSQAGTYPIVVSAGTLSAVNYTFTMVDGTLTVTEKLAPAISWNNPGDITYGTILSATQLNANTTIAGSFSYSPGPGTLLNAGQAQVLVATFTPTDTVKYSSMQKSVTINVAKAVLTVTADDKSMTVGADLPALTYTMRGFVTAYNLTTVSGTPDFSTTASSVSQPGTYPITITKGTLAAANYNFNFVAGTLRVNATSGGGFVGGGVPAAPGPVNGGASIVGVGGLIPSTDLTIDGSGVSQSAVQLRSKDMSMSLDIPEGTKLLDADGGALTNITAAKLESVTAPPSERAVIVAYDFGPDGAKFEPPLTLTLNFGEASLPSKVDLNSLQLVSWDGSSWVEIFGQVDLAAKTITAQISHFSQYALICSSLVPTDIPTTPLVTTSVETLTVNHTPEVTPTVTNSIPAIVTSTTQVSTQAPPSSIAEPVLSRTEAPVPVSQRAIPFSMLLLILTAVFVVVAIATILLKMRGRRSDS